MTRPVDEATVDEARSPRADRVEVRTDMGPDGRGRMAAMREEYSLAGLAEATWPPTG